MPENYSERFNLAPTQRTLIVCEATVDVRRLTGTRSAVVNLPETCQGTNVKLSFIALIYKHKVL